ncbi:Mannose-1-phosphate guanyltransferase alpha-A [Araneus ventricosus]|uniref:Mannose-1-phosphate guanyltransferase alpha-A n=1 Tax=Araneus ventricosus TaxID=182803 RepID=A0A4Y2CBJ5_ARAVE|nr:Mannose-1-phosphate guanyltransferase alpha-A [Araneus ventricosus]
MDSYKPVSYVAIDEQLSAFRGRCPFRMYILNKPAKYGIKIVMMCDVETNYMINAISYLGLNTQTKGIPLASYFVEEFTRNIQGTNRNVTMDTWFTSIPLAEKLFATRQQAQQYGCIVEDKNTHKIVHYVEKPSTFVSQIINCGIYLCSLDVFTFLATVFKQKQQDFYNGDEQTVDISGSAKDCISLEQDIVTPLAGKGKVYVFHSTRWWSQIKTAG